MKRTAACLVFAFISVCSLTAQSINNFRHPADLELCEAPGIANFLEKGEGSQAMLLIAGAPFGAEIWEEFMERNKAMYRMLAVTPAGYAGTAPPEFSDELDFTERIWSDAIIDDLAAAIEDRKMQDVVVIGHHLMGDYYALRLAAEHPDLVSRVVVLAGQGSQPAGQPRGGRTKLTQAPDLEARAKAVHEQRVPMFRGMKPETWAGGTFKGHDLTRDVVMGQRLYRKQLEVPIPTQLGYYMEYLTDDMAVYMPEIEAPILVLQLSVPEMDLSMLPEATYAQLLERYGSEEEMRKVVKVAAPWDVLARTAKSEITMETVDAAGIFLWIDQPEFVDGRLASFLGLEAAAKEKGGGDKADKADKEL